MHWKRDIEVLTPLFNRGAYQDTPELRVPSIRGMVRWWFRELGGTPDEEKLAFGGMKKFGTRFANDVIASNLVFRVSQIRTERANPSPLTLPHKQGGQGNPQAAFAPGASFHLEVFNRFGNISPDLERKVVNALEVWLLLGALGLRANRTGGNIWPADGAIPETATSLRRRLDECGCRWPVMLADTETGTSLDQLRAAATDTVSGQPDIFGEIRPERVASRVKLKIVRLNGELRLLITAPEERILIGARQALHGHRSKPETWSRL